jgi:TonB family protein
METSMKRALLIAVILTRSALALSTLTGVIQDEANSPISGARLRAMHVSDGKTIEATSSNGRYMLTGLRRGEYILSVEKDGFGVVLGAVRLSADDQRELGFVLKPAPFGSVQAAPPHRTPVQDAEPASENKPKIEQARLRHQVAPIYPERARNARISGSVSIEVQLGVDGRLDEMVVLSAPSADLAIAALLAVQQWRYSPVRADGKPVPAITTISVTFRL